MKNEKKKVNDKYDRHKLRRKNKMIRSKLSERGVSND